MTHCSKKKKYKKHRKSIVKVQTVVESLKEKKPQRVTVIEDEDAARDIETKK